MTKRTPATDVTVTTIKIVALYVPEFRLSLLSVSQLAVQKYTTMFTSEFCLIHDDKKSLMLHIPPVNGLYRFTTVSFNITHTTALITTRSGAGKDLPAARRQSSHIQPIAPAHDVTGRIDTGRAVRNREYQLDETRLDKEQIVNLSITYCKTIVN
jgi:hypothetical protein